jgi:pimeloyl-ACP methyl ester carboxylesterase
VVLPDPELIGDPPLLCFAKPSGAYSRGYYTCDLPGPGSGVSQAEWHARRGWIFVALDTLGCGASSRHEADALDFANVCLAAHAAEREITLRLANGMLDPGFPPVHRPTVIGVGQSAGGSLVVYQQAHHRSYDGIAMLGFSAVHSHPMVPPGGEPVLVAWFPRDLPMGAEPLNAAELDTAMAEGADGSAWHSLAWSFHYDDVPEAVIEQNLLHYEAISQGLFFPDDPDPVPWKSYTTPHRAARSTLTPGVVATEAAAVAVPVLSALGERDIVPDPAGEPRAFRSAPSVDVFVCPRLGHMHNFGGTRALFWERIHGFGEFCAAWKEAGAGGA